MNTDPPLVPKPPVLRKDWRFYIGVCLIFVMGGEFWGKFRRIFVWEGRV